MLIQQRLKGIVIEAKREEAEPSPVIPYLGKVVLIRSRVTDLNVRLNKEGKIDANGAECMIMKPLPLELCSGVVTVHAGGIVSWACRLPLCEGAEQGHRADCEWSCDWRGFVFLVGYP